MLRNPARLFHRKPHGSSVQRLWCVLAAVMVLVASVLQPLAATAGGPGSPMTFGVHAHGTPHQPDAPTDSDSSLLLDGDQGDAGADSPDSTATAIDLPALPSTAADLQLAQRRPLRGHEPAGFILPAYNAKPFRPPIA